MATRERRSDRARDRAQRMRSAIGLEIKETRVGLDLSQAQVAGPAGVSQSYLSLIEHGRAPGLTLDTLVAICEPLGLAPSLKVYPSGRPLRDAAHSGLLERLRERLSERVHWQTEVPIELVGDMRAWDAVITLASVRIGVEAETRLRDLQALERRVALKKRDGRADRVILLVADTRANRALMRGLGLAPAGTFPVPGRVALKALATGRDPGGDAIILR